MESGELQDLGMNIRFHLNQIEEYFAQALKGVFGSEIVLTNQDVKDLNTVYQPFEWSYEDWADENDPDMTLEYFNGARQQHFDIIKRLRPALLELLELSEDKVQYMVCDLGIASNDEIENIDLFLIAAFRFQMVNTALFNGIKW